MQSSIDHSVQGRAALHLTDEQGSVIRAALQEIADEHRRRLEENQELFRELVSDASVDAAERQAARLAASHALEVCQQAGEAIAALDDGSYGRCGGCGEPIPFERLEVLPLTQSCIACPPA